MVKTAGKICVALTALWVVVTHAQVSLEIRSNRGEPIEQVAIGEPFQVEITIKNIAGHPTMPRLAGDEHISCHRTGKRTSIINGNTTHTYTYRAQVNEPGKYQLGPAQVTVAGQEHESNQMVLTASEQTVTRGGRRKQARGDQVEARLMVGKQSAIVGEEIPCELRFYCDDTPIEVVPQFGQPALDSFLIKNVSGPRVEQESNGRRYVEWSWSLYPKKAGDITIPAHNVDYDVPSQRESIWWGMAPWGMRVERKRAYSNGIRIAIEELPDDARDVDAIGDIEQVTAHISPAVARQGEGMVLALDVEGRDGVDQIERFELQNMPDSLRHYESKRVTLPPDDSSSSPRRRFEYVVQGLEAGSWLIPEQTISYFDPASRTRKTVQTSPLSVTITPGSALAVTRQVSTPEDEDTSTPHQIVAGLCPLHEDGPIHESGAPLHVPWFLFAIFMALPLGWSAYLSIDRVWQRYYRRNAQEIRAKNAFRSARSKLNKIRAGKSSSSVYHVLLQCIAERLMRSSLDISHDEIEETLQNAGFASEQLVAWRTFFNRSAEQTYGSSSPNADDDLLSEAYDWLSLLEGTL